MNKLNQAIKLLEEIRDEQNKDEQIPKFSLLKLFKITVPKNYKHATQLKDFININKKDFYYFNPDIADKNFKNVSNKLVPGKTYQVKIWNILNNVSPEECLQYLKENNVILVGTQGLSLLWQEAKDELPVGKWIVSFDEKERLWKDTYGYRRMPVIKQYSDGGWDFGLGSFENDWDDCCVLMGFCDLES